MHFYSAYFLFVLGIYIAATFSYCLRVILDKKNFSVGALRLVLVGFVVHVLTLGLHLYRQGYPYFVSSFEWNQMISGSIILIFLLLCFSYRFITTGVFILPLALLFYIISLTDIVAYQTPGHVLQNPWAFEHIVFMFIAVAIFMVSFITGILYMIQEHRIKRKLRGGFFDRLPSLEVLDSIHYRALYVGFVFFTIGIITGGGWSKSMLGVYVSNNFKQLFSFVLWIFFALFLNLRVSRGWVGRKGVLLSSMGFVAVFILLSWIGK